MKATFAAVFAFIFGFVVGAGTMLDKWDESARRGHFETGGVLYKVERISP